jgi:hypothetical protein
MKILQGGYIRKNLIGVGGDIRENLFTGYMREILS